VNISKQYQNQIGCHGYEHTERVVETCKILAKSLNPNMKILIPAAILHDIGRGRNNHAYQSALIAKQILIDNKYKYIDEIVHAITVHSFSAGGEAKTLEAKILNDSDKLDAMGAIGVYRAAQYSIENKRSYEDFIKHFHEKLLNLKELLYTSEAKILAEKRHKFMLLFIDQINKEINGLS
jgi:uncharacterized protein